MANGLAEVVKYAAAMDEGLFGILEREGDNILTTPRLSDIVLRCCRLKADVVESDETERTGQRAILNFGHTVGHALEAVTAFKGKGHGAAVAVGIVAAARISQRLGMIDASDVERIKSRLIGFMLPVSCHGVKSNSLLKAIRYDKKTTLGQTRWVLVEGIGQGITSQTVPDDVVSKVLEELCR